MTQLILIAEVDNFIYTQLQEVMRVGKNYNLSEDEIDLFFDWCVNQILTIDFNIHVIHHYRHDVFLCVFTDLQNTLRDSFLRCVSFNDLNLFKGCQVKTMINGTDLFITRRLKINKIV